MLKSDKPLFSRPVLAVIIVASTLAIWLLNLTAPHTELATPKIENWQTKSGIPVYWVNQDIWQGQDKLAISFVFQGDTGHEQLTAATLGMLLGPSLPLSTATINQRLAPAAANVDSDFDHQQQTLNVTLSSQPQYLAPALKVLDTWFNDTQFKATPLETWQRQYTADPARQQLWQQLLYAPENPFTKPQRTITLDSVNTYLQHLKSHVSHILIAGAMDEDAQRVLARALSSITKSLKHSTFPSPWQLAAQPATATLGSNELSAIYGAVGMQPLSSVEDWLAQQIWARDMLQSQKDQLGSQVPQWALHLGREFAYANWQVDVPTQVFTDSQPTQEMKSSWIEPTSLPSYQDSSRFNELKAQLLAQLESLAQNPNWWAIIGSRVALPNSALTLETFSERYSEAANSFTIEQYQQHLDALLIPSSRQEVQVKQ